MIAPPSLHLRLNLDSMSAVSTNTESIFPSLTRGVLRTSETRRFTEFRHLISDEEVSNTNDTVAFAFKLTTNNSDARVGSEPTAMQSCCKSLSRDVRESRHSWGSR